MTDKLTISKIDEVYCCVRCSNPGIAQELSAYFTFRVPGYQFTPAYRNKYWDGNKRLYNMMSGRLYLGLVKYVEKFAKERDYDVEYAYDNTADSVSLHEIEEFVKKIISKSRIDLDFRDYQIKAIADAVRYKRTLYRAATNSGKSLIIYSIMRWYLTPTLIVVPTISLVHQMYDDFKDYGFDSDKYVHKIYQGQDKKTDRPVVITTWQSIYKQPMAWFDRFGMIIGDEAHTFKAKSLTSIMEKTTSVPIKLGFTGSLDNTKTHRLVLEGLFGPVNNVVTQKELIDQGYSSKLDIKALVLKHPESVRMTNARSSYHDEIDSIVRSESRNKFIKNLSLSIEGNTLLLFQFVEKHGKILHEMIQKEAGDRKVFFIWGGVKGEDRNKIRAIVEKENDAIIVASFGTFSTGINIKKIHNLVFASPSKSMIRIVQSIGRGVRKSDDKEHCTLYDVVDDLRWKNYINYALHHFSERMKIYDSEQHEYRIYNIKLR